MFGRAFELLRYGPPKWDVEVLPRVMKGTRRDPSTANDHEPRGFKVLDYRPARHFAIRRGLIVLYGRPIHVTRRRRSEIVATVSPCEFCGNPVFEPDKHTCPALLNALTEEAARREMEDL